MTTQITPQQAPNPSKSGAWHAETADTDTLSNSESAVGGRERPNNIRSLPGFAQALPFVGEILIAVSGSLILWWGAEGRGVTNVNMLGLGIFLVVMAALMVGRGLTLALLSGSTMNQALPTATRWLNIARNIMLMLLAVYFRYVDDYLSQWMVAFGAIALASTAVFGLVLACVRRDPRSEITSRFLDAGAGLLALVFAQNIHQWDGAFIATVASMVLVPGLVAWMITSAGIETDR